MIQNSHDMKKVSVEQKSKQNEKKNESEAKGDYTKGKKERWRNAMKSYEKQTAESENVGERSQCKKSAVQSVVCV